MSVPTAAMAELFAVADCGYLHPAGLWLFFLPCQLDRRAA